MLRHTVDLAFLLLSTLLIITLLTNSYQNYDTSSFKLELQTFSSEIRSAMNNHTNYLETRINRVAEAQDQYQVSTSGKLEILEVKIALLEKENKELKTQNKVINYNNSSAVINK